MKNLLFAVVMLFAGAMSAQIVNPPEIGWRGGQVYNINGTDYTVPERDFRVELAAVRDGEFDWSWTQPISDISATQIFFDPAGNPEHRSDYMVTLTRNGQSGNVTVTVTSTTSVGQYRWGTATAPTSSVDHSDINRAIADARASLSVGESAYIWTTATTSYHATLGQTEILVRAPDGNGGNVIGGSAAPTRGQEVQYDEPDVWGPWVYSHSEVTDANWASTEADFGTSEGPTVVVSRSRTRINRGTIRETLAGNSFQEFLFTNTGATGISCPGGTAATAPIADITAYFSSQGLTKIAGTGTDNRYEGTVNGLFVRVILGDENFGLEFAAGVVGDFDCAESLVDAIRDVCDFAPHLCSGYTG